MRFDVIEVENFRSIRAKVKVAETKSRLFTFVGANNVGKSNILRAINLFFNGEIEPGVRFDPKVDLRQGTQKALIAATLSFKKDSDGHMTSYLDKNHDGEFADYVVPITLSCKANGATSYSFATRKGQRKNLPELVDRIREYVNCIYIPAIKDYRTIIDLQMMRKIVAATFQGWGKGRLGSTTIGQQKEKFKKLLKEIQDVLDESGDYVSQIVTSVVPSLKRFSFSLPYDNLEDFLGRLVFSLEDTHLDTAISLGSVGSGIQSFSIYSMLRLLHEIRPTNTYRKAKFLWLIEEPETFMHHDLQRKTQEKLREYAHDGHIFITTHSPVFIDKRTLGSSYVVTHNGATSLKHISAKSIREVIAGILGVKLQDFLDFKRFNILVEGDTDRELLLELNQLFKKAGKAALNDDDVEFIPCGSANGIVHFWGLYNAFNRYADFICLFDRDPAGLKAREEILAKGAPKENALLIPDSTHKRNAAIEDIVGKQVWVRCIDKLDGSGLVKVLMQQGETIDYNYEHRDRIEVKRAFVKHLAEEAKRDLADFKLYEKLLEDLARRVEQLAKVA